MTISEFKAISEENNLCHFNALPQYMGEAVRSPPRYWEGVRYVLSPVDPERWGAAAIVNHENLVHFFVAPRSEGARQEAAKLEAGGSFVAVTGSTGPDVYFHESASLISLDDRVLWASIMGQKREIVDHAKAGLFESINISDRHACDLMIHMSERIVVVDHPNAVTGNVEGMLSFYYEIIERYPPDIMGVRPRFVRVPIDDRRELLLAEDENGHMGDFILSQEGRIFEGRLAHVVFRPSTR